MSDVTLKQILTETSKFGKLSDKSLNSYISQLRTIHRLYHNKPRSKDSIEVSDLAFLKESEPSEIKQILDDNYTNQNSKRNLVNVIINFLQYFETDGNNHIKDKLKEYGKIRDDYHANYEEKVQSNQKTQRQKDNWITMDQYDSLLEKMLEEIKRHKSWDDPDDSKNFDRVQRYVILKFYRHFNLRNDLHAVKILSKSDYKNLDEKEKTENYLIINSAGTPKYILRIYDFKTNRTHEVIDIPIKDRSLSQLVARWLKYRGKDSTYLFSQLNDRNKPLSSSKLSNIIIGTFEKFLNRRVGSSLLRHIRISEKYADTIESMKETAKQSGHDINTLIEYAKFTDKDKDEKDDKDD